MSPPWPPSPVMDLASAVTMAGFAAAADGDGATTPEPEWTEEADEAGFATLRNRASPEVEEEEDEEEEEEVEDIRDLLPP